MNEKRLDQYRLLKIKLKNLNEDLKNLRETGPIYAADSVSTATVFPYTPHTLTVHGLDIIGFATKENRLKMKLKEIEDTVNEMNDIEVFIDSISDMRIKMVFEYRYMKGWSWMHVALNTGWSDEGSPRKKVENYLKNSENSENSEL